jgi:hypothetical protein
VPQGEEKFPFVIDKSELAERQVLKTAQVFEWKGKAKVDQSCEDRGAPKSVDVVYTAECMTPDGKAPSPDMFKNESLVHSTPFHNTRSIEDHGLQGTATVLSRMHGVCPGGRQIWLGVLERGEEEDVKAVVKRTVKGFQGFVRAKAATQRGTAQRKAQREGGRLRI